MDHFALLRHFHSVLSEESRMRLRPMCHDGRINNETLSAKPCFRSEIMRNANAGFVSIVFGLFGVEFKTTWRIVIDLCLSRVNDIQPNEFWVLGVDRRLAGGPSRRMSITEVESPKSEAGSFIAVTFRTHSISDRHRHRHRRASHQIHL